MSQCNWFHNSNYFCQMSTHCSLQTSQKSPIFGSKWPNLNILKVIQSLYCDHPDHPQSPARAWFKWTFANRCTLKVKWSVLDIFAWGCCPPSLFSNLTLWPIMFWYFWAGHSQYAFIDTGYHKLDTKQKPHFLTKILYFEMRGLWCSYQRWLLWWRQKRDFSGLNICSSSKRQLLGRATADK